MKHSSTPWVVFALAAALARAQTTPCSAQSVWERMIEAKGGRAKLNSIETFLTFGEYVWRNFLVSHRLQTRGFYRFPDFSWQAPGEVAGVLQINALIPAGIGSGPQPVVLRIGQASSPPGVFVMVG